MSSFTVDTGVLRTCEDNMLTEYRYAQAGYSRCDHITSVTAADGGGTFDELAQHVHDAGEVVATLFTALSRFWQYSAQEMGQTATYYDRMDEEARQAADDTYLTSDGREEEDPRP